MAFFNLQGKLFIWQTATFPRSTLIHVAGMWEDASTRQGKGVCIHTKKGPAVCRVKNMFCKSPNCWMGENTATIKPAVFIPQVSRWLHLHKTIDEPISELYHFWLREWIENISFLLRTNTRCSPISTLSEEIPASQMGKRSALWILTSNWQGKSLKYIACHVPGLRNLLFNSKRTWPPPFHRRWTEICLVRVGSFSFVHMYKYVSTYTQRSKAVNTRWELGIYDIIFLPCCPTHYLDYHIKTEANCN